MKFAQVFTALAVTALAQASAIPREIEARAAIVVKNASSPVVQCNLQTGRFTWTGGAGCFSSFVKNAQGQVVKTLNPFGCQAPTWFTWSVNVAPGNYEIVVQDQTGATGSTGLFPVVAGSSSCL